MGCGCKSPSGADYLTCNGVSTVYTEAEVSPYAHRVGALIGDQLCLIVACLRINRIIYYKQSPGDCGSPTSGLSTTLAVSKGLSGGSSAAGAVGGLATAGSSFALAATGIGIVVGIGALITGIIGAHHAAAVATEQATLCDLSNKWAQYASAVEQGVASGQYNLQDANTNLASAIQQLDAGIQHIYKSCNAACYYRKVLQALLIFNKEKVYPSLVPKPVAGGILGNLGKGLGTSTFPKVALLGGAAVAAKVLLFA